MHENFQYLINGEVVCYHFKFIIIDHKENENILIFEKDFWIYFLKAASENEKVIHDEK